MKTYILTSCDAGTLRAGLCDGTNEVQVELTKPARQLADLHMLLAATSGKLTTMLCAHLEEHFNSTPTATCEFCKLEGRILASQGRRRLREEELRKAKLTVVPLGVSGAQLEAAQRPPQQTRYSTAKGGEVWF